MKVIIGGLLWPTLAWLGYINEQNMAVVYAFFGMFVWASSEKAYREIVTVAESALNLVDKYAERLKSLTCAH